MQIVSTRSAPRFLVYAFFCLILPFFTSCGSSKTIVNALDEKDANEILVYLSGKGIDAVKTQSGEGGGGGGGSKVVLWDIQVSEDKATEAMALLNQVGLPRRRGQSLLGIFAASGLVPSELQEKIRYQAGLAEQIASTIRKIDGVLDAEVQISFPEEDPLGHAENKGKITSSVYVKHSGVLDDPNSHLVPKIKRLVAASVTGLDYDNVTVIGDRARYSGLPIAGPAVQEEKPLTSTWTIIMAKESVTRFRLIFFSFMVLILILVIAFVWFVWKTYPLLEAHGGVKELFHIHPIALTPKEAEAKKEGEAEKEKAQKAEKEAATKVEETEKNIDET